MFDLVDEQIDNDIWSDMTPDLPALRYAGEQLVFLWDELRSHSQLHAMLKDTGHNVENFNAVTQNPFSPFRNSRGSSKDKFVSYLTPDLKWASSMKDKGGDNGVLLRNITPHPVRGKIIDVSLKSLYELDKHYRNTYTHTRRKISVLSQDNKVCSCWVYFTNLASISKYDYHEGYTLDKDIFVAPFDIQKTTTSKPELSYSSKYYS